MHKPTKAEFERNADSLRYFLKLPENQLCADCGYRDPRWASCNLGVFLCIDCSGVHRSLGVHISRVKSIDLDSWTADQVEVMRQWGNGKANQYWAAKLGAVGFYVKGSREYFIRAKYERKEFVAGKSQSLYAERTPKKDSGMATKAKETSLLDLWDEPIAVNSSLKTPTVVAVEEDDFGDFQSCFAGNEANVGASSTETQSQPSNFSSKATILSLYSQPTKKDKPNSLDSSLLDFC